MTFPLPITVSFGDGAGPDIMTATLNILRHANVPLHMHMVEIGQRAYHHGFRYGIPASCMDKIMEYKILLQAPMGPPPLGEYEVLDLAAYLECNRTILSEHDTNDVYIPKHASMQAVAHIGERYAFFEPTHGHFPELTDQDIANPSSMILAAVLMLEHLKLRTHAIAIKEALYRTLAEGYRTQDMVEDGLSVYVSTTEFASAIIERLDQKIVKFIND